MVSKECRDHFKDKKNVAEVLSAMASYIDHAIVSNLQSSDASLALTALVPMITVEKEACNVKERFPAVQHIETAEMYRPLEEHIVAVEKLRQHRQTTTNINLALPRSKNLQTPVEIKTVPYKPNAFGVMTGSLNLEKHLMGFAVNDPYKSVIVHDVRLTIHSVPRILDMCARYPGRICQFKEFENNTPVMLVFFAAPRKTNVPANPVAFSGARVMAVNGRVHESFDPVVDTIVCSFGSERALDAKTNTLSVQNIRSIRNLPSYVVTEEEKHIPPTIQTNRVIQEYLARNVVKAPTAIQIIGLILMAVFAGVVMTVITSYTSNSIIYKQ